MIRLVNADRRPDFSGVTPIWVAVTTLFFVAVLAGHFYGKRTDRDLVPCVFKLVTKHPCVLCQGTSASVQLVKGDAEGAFKLNPLVTVLVIGVALISILKFGFGRGVRFSGVLASQRVRWVLVIALVLANWIYLLVFYD